MDKALKKDIPAKVNPVVVFANWFQFGAGMGTNHQRVESRMLLWCEKGCGSVAVNGTKMDFLPGDWLLLPWAHRIVYLADPISPFLVGGVHLVPDHDVSKPVVFQVAHHADDPFAGLRCRRDVAWPHLDGFFKGRFCETSRLQLLATYIVERFQSREKDENSMRDLARLLIDELIFSQRADQLGARPLPALLRRLREFLRGHLEEEITVERMARISGVSEAGLHRLFRAHTGVSPARHLVQLRVEKAALLLRTTTLSVAEIGIQVGLQDPFHFSRLFKRKMGLSPTAYQKSRRFF